MALGKTIRKLRVAAGMTVAELASASGLDESAQQAISALENRDSKSSKLAPALAKGLRVPLTTLLSENEGRPPLHVAHAPETDGIADAINWLTLFSQLSPNGRKMLREFGELLLSKERSGHSSVNHQS